MVLAEPNARWVAAQLDGAKGELKMNTVNLAEAIIVVDYRHPTAAAGLQTLLANTPALGPL
ncbi:MAG: hypothetical protein MN733_08330 [Nitrososphaera sp.]|nr:hypothetical protein [Nitrososphaera sp.]